MENYSDYDNLGLLIKGEISNFRNNIAITSDHKSVSYLELTSRIKQKIDNLSNLDIDHWNPVIIEVDNSWQDLVNIIAALCLNLVVIPINHNTSTTTLSHILEETSAKYILAKRKLVDKANNLGFTQYSDGILMKSSTKLLSEDILKKLEGVALIVYSSGTTGKPKGIMQCHSTYIGKIQSIISSLNFNPSKITYQCLQLAFSFCQWTSFITLLKGGHLYLEKKFDSHKAVEVISSNDIGWTPVVPTMFRMLFSELKEDEIEKVANDIDCIFISGGEVLPKNLGIKVVTTFPNTSLGDVYGLTETNSADFIVQPGSYTKFAGTLGELTNNVEFEIRPLSSQESSADPNFGELYIRTDYLMKGYLSSSSTLVKDHFFATGDLASLDINGRVALKGRVKELINKGGLKVNPLEVEQALESLPQIKMALVCSLDDSIYGEKIGALISAYSGANEENIKNSLREKIDSFKIPDEMIFLDKFPSGPTGKTSRKLIQDIFEQI
jgi:malonyl-CoA/methylmalonyl-CoA synthetase